VCTASTTGFGGGTCSSGRRWICRRNIYHPCRSPLCSAPRRRPTRRSAVAVAPQVRGGPCVTLGPATASRKRLQLAAWNPGPPSPGAGAAGAEARACASDIRRRSWSPEPAGGPGSALTSSPTRYRGAPPAPAAPPEGQAVRATFRGLRAPAKARSSASGLALQPPALRRHGEDLGGHDLGQLEPAPAPSGVGRPRAGPGGHDALHLGAPAPPARLGARQGPPRERQAPDEQRRGRRERAGPPVPPPPRRHPARPAAARPAPRAPRPARAPAAAVAPPRIFLAPPRPALLLPPAPAGGGRRRRGIPYCFIIYMSQVVASRKGGA